MVEVTAPSRAWRPAAPLALALSLGGVSACTEVPRTYSTAFAPGREIVRDDFERDELGEQWFLSGDGVKIEDGHLVVEGAKNHPAWLTTPLPDAVRIEFDAWTDDEEGDIKVELAGDGSSFATTVNYVATGYVFVFGGWNNRLNVIARQNEHGADRVSTSEPNVVPGRRYHMTIIRKDSDVVWDVDGVEILRMEDPEPLVGDGHEHFAFSGWESRVYFDNLVVTDLAEAQADGNDGGAP